MRRKRLSAVYAALVLGVSPVLAIMLPGVAHAAAPYTCTWTGSGGNSNFSTAGNWSGCNSAAPQAADGDSLIFNETTSAQTLNDDITGLEVNSITFQGSDTAGVTIGGDNILLGSGGIIENSGSDSDDITAPVTLSVASTITMTQGIVSLSSLDVLTYGLQVLTTSNGQDTTIVNSLSGSGAITLSNSALLSFSSVASNYTGTITVDNGAELEADFTNGNPLGSGPLIIQSGAQFLVDSTNDTATISNPITVAGDGISSNGAIVSCLGISQSCEGDGNNSNLTLSDVVLSGNTQVVNGAYYSAESSPPAQTATFTITSLTANGNTLSGIADSSTILAGDIGSSGSGPSSNSAPKTPDTGAALVSSKTGMTFIGTTVVAIGLYGIARKLKPIAERR